MPWQLLAVGICGWLVPEVRIGREEGPAFMAKTVGVGHPIAERGAQSLRRTGALSTASTRFSATQKVEQTNGGVNNKRHRESSPKRFSQFFSGISSVDNEVQKDWGNAEYEKAISMLPHNGRNQCKKLATKLKTIIQITIGVPFRCSGPNLKVRSYPRSLSESKEHTGRGNRHDGGRGPAQDFKV
jgi:hypothetical protein